MLQCVMLAAVPEWLSNIWFLLQVLIGFSLIVFVHELGHFAAAKWAGVRVERFAVGFGKELVGFTKGETRYSFNILPLGGYVKMLGQEDFVVDKSGELKVKEDPSSFTNKPVGKRMVIVTAGVIMNLIFAAIAFTAVAMVGRKQIPPVIGFLSEGSPAANAGLQPGDRILEINGVQVDDFNHLSMMISLSDEDEELELKVERDGAILTPYPKVLPVYMKDKAIRQIGVGYASNPRMRFPGPLLAPPDRYLQQNDELHEFEENGKRLPYRADNLVRAMLRAEGGPVRVWVKRPKKPDALTEKQIYGTDDDFEHNEVPVDLRLVWNPLPSSEDRATASLLGLIPRLTITSRDYEKSFHAAGALSGDVIVEFDSKAYVTFGDVREIIEGGDGKQIPIKVRRPWAENNGLSAAAVAFCVEHRETIIEAALKSVSDGTALLTKLSSESERLGEADRTKLASALADQKSGSDWRTWLEQVDVHKLEALEPKAPFSLLGDPVPTLDARLRCDDENHVVVAGIVKQIGEKDSPAYSAGIPTGAVLLAINGKPIKHWYEVSKAFRASAGTTVDIRYRLVDQYFTKKMAVPGSIQASLDLVPGDRIVKIGGESRAVINDPEGVPKQVELPDWRVAQALLSKSIGKTVPIEIATLDGQTRKAEYAVTATNVDQWLGRIHYSVTFDGYPLWERNPISNPITALVVGSKQAYRATMQTVNTIKHMIFTRKVGVNKISGPVGILRIGSRVAESGLIDLIWLLGLLSANLAVINFLPLPIVDGGLFLFLVLEKIRGEPVSIKTQVATQLIGIALIATLFILVTYQDIVHWITGA